ncbi:hypothetical protein MKW94_026603 [Papaver nudicaule]|uniref:DUF7866 domain-containing protein n=1 Tax=Papaver nudicaule TaxID=74823 RepID=A0AA41V6Y8_PAPNU|nr:hypothetical protein [Papaver nudicaule]
MSGFGFLYPHFLFLVFFLTIFTLNQAHGLEEEQNSLMVPAVSDSQSRMMSSWMSEKFRGLRSFRVCGLCTCCGRLKGLCFLSPCCYHINCNLPDRPFGFCSFTPKSCYCFGCHL